jgi:hypothetical protein
MSRSRSELERYRQLVATYELPVKLSLVQLVERGEEPRHVADALSRLGYKGFKGHACECPLSRFLQDRFPDLEFAVHGDSVTVRVDPWVSFTVPTEYPYGAFVRGFDAGLWPELVIPTDDIGRPIHTTNSH